ncbi:MAG: A/G-specific adenine glycosylase [Chloroflexi bacterium]|nr:A/G-specific adenine glycosylase [Chloroflexota bacterium]
MNSTQPTTFSVTFPSNAEQLARIQQHLIDWFEANGRDLPWRRTRDPYRVLVSEIMLQQTQVDRVKPKYAAFLEQFPSLEALAAATPGDVIRAWAGLGYNRRALNLQRTAQAVINDHEGRFPETPEALRNLPGIGPYTAGAVACFAFERDVAFMDTNIRRVVQRLFVGPDDTGASDRELIRIAEAAVPQGRGWIWNQAIMELGALICTASRPRCQICPLRAECRAYAAWRTADQDVFNYTPPPKPKAARAVAESKTPFTSTSRYFRGRTVDTLRQLEPGHWLALAELGPRVKPDWADADREWLLTLLHGLAADGLIELDEAGDQARLP